MKGVMQAKSFAFAIRIIRLCEYLKENKKEFALIKQLLRSGTSIGAQVREAQNAQSSADFIHKLFIAQKECDETRYWLELMHESNYLTTTEFDSIHAEATELLKMIRSAILTTKQKQQLPR